MVGLGYICIMMVFAKSNFISRSGKMLLGYFLSDVAFSKLSYLPLLLTWSYRVSVNNLPYAITRHQILYWTLWGSKDFNITLKPRFQCLSAFTKNGKVMLWTETEWIWQMGKIQIGQNIFHNITYFLSPTNTMLWKYHLCLTTWSPLKIVENLVVVTLPSILNKKEFTC